MSALEGRGGIRYPARRRRCEHRTHLVLLLAFGKEAAQLHGANRAGSSRLSAVHTSDGKRFGDPLTADPEAARDLFLRQAAPVQLCHRRRIRVVLFPPARERAGTKRRAVVWRHGAHRDRSRSAARPPALGSTHAFTRGGLDPARSPGTRSERVTENSSSNSLIVCSPEQEAHLVSLHQAWG